ncbi:MAG: hypothetical protein AAGB15_01785 [Pseudomonadota bacterium]
MGAELGTTCLVALDHAAAIDPAALRRSFVRVAPRSSLILATADDDEADHALKIQVDGHGFGAALFDTLIPQPEFGQALRRSLFWPEAAALMAGHTAFIAIGASERPDAHGLARAKAVALTRLVAALVEDLPVSGIYWHNAGTCSAPQRMARAVDEIDRGQWPIDLWLGWQHFRPLDAEQAVLGLQTVGARDYIGIELEIPPAVVLDPKEPLRILLNAAGYLMARGGTIEQGQTIEVSGERSAIAQLLLDEANQPVLARLTIQPTDERTAG